MFILIKTYKKLLFSFFLIGIVLGVCINYLPEKFITTGSFYVTRKTEPNTQEYFTYEGYYGQQSATSYTNTVLALAKSTDVLKSSLEKMKIDLTEPNLRKYERAIIAKKSGPQLITVTVKSKTKKESLDFWNFLAQSLIEKNIYIQANGDTNLKIIQISEEPLIKTQYKSNILFGITGGLLTLGAGIVFISLKEYLK